MSRANRKQKRRLTMGTSFHKRRGVSQYIREAYGQKERKGHLQID